MKKWHEMLWANLGLRMAGLILLAIGSAAALSLRQWAVTSTTHEATPMVMLLAAIIFLCGSFGCTLSFVGPGLWDRVQVSERWQGSPPHISGEG